MFNKYFELVAKKSSISIVPVFHEHFKNWSNQLDKKTLNWFEANNFSAKPNTVCVLPDGQGKISKVFLGLADADDFWAFGILPTKLPAGIYRIEANWSQEQMQKAMFGWGVGCYQFTVYKNASIQIKAKLELSEIIDSKYLENLLSSLFWVRDLINYPAADMTPAILSKAAYNLAKDYGATFEETSGQDLVKKGYLGIYTVGRASPNLPRLIDLRWGKKNAPKIVLVGKGVCFDSGGLELKPFASMMVMKKDMAGAAHALGLAKMIMTANLPINLRVLIPAAENVLGSNSYKPGDVIHTYKGTNVEVTGTDAEGRLLLADALALSSEEKPDLLIDFATLTGAARVALGPEIAAMFSNDQKLAQQILAIAAKEKDPIWQLPIYESYKNMLDSDIADISNSANSSFAGAITAALFLREFVDSSISWLHFDMTAYNMGVDKPGKPKGGDVQVLQTLFRYLYSLYNA